jgi:DNA-binding CsgD family transcriptional regulator
LLEDSLALARIGGDARRIVQALCNLGYATLLQGNHLDAIALCDEALAFAHQLGTESADIVPEALINLGLASLELDERERAATSFEEALTSSQKAGIKPSVINALEGMASLNGARGETPRAARLWGAAEAARELTGIALPPGELELHEGHLATARAQLGETAWEEAVAEGRAMSLDEAAEYALGKVPEPIATPEEPAAGDSAGDLTRREREVVTLVARGMTNRQIAGELSISERTAANHVARILRKLHLHSRTQIVTWTTEQGLLGPEQN